MKRTISIFIALLLFISSVPVNAFASADVIFPEFESIHVDQNQVTTGDTVKVSVKATDDVGIKTVRVAYKAPITQKTFSVTLNYNSDTNTYDGTISIPSTFENGVYKVWYVSIYDTSDNNLLFDDASQLVNGEFTVSGTAADVTFPVFESIQVDQTEVTAGDTVKVSLKASDDVGIKTVRVSYKAPITQKTFSVTLSYKSETNTYEGTIPITSSFESGLYKVWYVSIYDTSDNNVLFDEADQLVNGAFSVSGTNADVTFPVFESIAVDQQKVTAGDTVKVSLKASDDVGIKTVRVSYKAPITQKTFSVTLNYNSETNTFEGSIPVSSNFETGVYKVWYVSIYDTSDNNVLFDEADQLVNGEFTFFSESNPPSFSNLSIDKSVAESGDAIHVTVDATDDTNLQGATVYFLSPVTQTKVAVPLSYNGSQLVGDFSIDGSTEVGSWVVDSIEIKDTNLNSVVVRATETDLSAGTFTVIQGVESLDFRMVSSDETWSNMTVNKDVYIVPGARLTINGNVTITGDVYVLGGLRVYGGLRSTGSLIAHSFTFGYYTPGDGQVIMSGSNSISSLVATSHILSGLPFELHDTPIVSSDGKVNVSGATIPVVSMEINGQSVAVKSNGTFRVNDFYIGDSTSLQVKLTDLTGYTQYHSYDVAEIFVDDFSKNSTEITGRTLANMTVRILDADRVLATGSTDDNGYFSIPVSGLVENATLTFETVNADDQVTASRDVVVADITAPDQPVINEVTDKDSVVTGQAEAGASVEVKAGNAVIGTAVVAADGTFAVAIPVQKAGSSLTVSAVDAAGNVSEAASVVVKDATGPDKPYVYYDVTDQTTVIEGGTEPGAKVEAAVNGSVIGSFTAGSDGYFAIAIPAQKAGTEITVTAVDLAGNVGDAVTLVVTDVTPPSAPVVNEVTDKDKTITGSAEPGALIEIFGGDWEGAYQGRADADGQFAVGISYAQKAGTELRIVQYDAVYHISEPTIIVVKDGTAPVKPVLNEVTNRDTVVKGRAEAGASVEVAGPDGTVIGRDTVRSDGSFSVAIPVQAVGAELTVRATDLAGNVSEAGVVVVVKAKLAGWVSDGGIWYYYDPATYDVKVGWYKVGSSWYYSNSSGAMQTGWVQDGSTWYYMSGSGAMVTGWLKVGAVWYFFGSSGAMATGWLKSGATWYYFAGSGAMQVGWLKSGAVWYYFVSSGAMVTGWVKIGGKSYYFDSNGVWRK